MDLQVILPLIGVVLGWLLNQFSQLIKAKYEDKRLISEAIYIIYDLLFTLEQTQSVLNGVIKSKRFTPMSKQFFESSLEDDILRAKTFPERTNLAILNISKFDPILAQQLRVFSTTSASIFETIEKIPNNAMENDFKLDQIEACYKTIRIHAEWFTWLIKKLALKHSIALWLKFLIKQRSKRNPMEKDIWEKFFKIT
jgi:hypothetical protein